MRVPSPAASTIVRLVLPVIPVLKPGLRRRRHKAFEPEWKPGFRSNPVASKVEVRKPADFLLMFVA